LARKDLDDMSYLELQNLGAGITKAIGAAREREKAQLREQIEALVNGSGLDVAELFDGRRGKGRRGAPKYANPDDKTQTWSGRGRKPNWLVAKGGNVDTFLIK
jgi:DNA-binding protein H-NS